MKLISITFILLLLSFTVHGYVDPLFVQAIDAATLKYVRSDEWTNTLLKAYLPTLLPDCTSTPTFPATFAFNKSVINYCYDKEAQEPWVTYHLSASKLLTRTLNEHYNLNLTYVINTYDTSSGYFASLNAKVQSGECDVAIAATNHNAERAQVVHFQCPYGMGSKSFLRNTYQNESMITDVKQLDTTKYTVVVPTGTTYEAWLIANFKNAKIVKIPGYDEGWEMIMNNTAHAFFGDFFDTSRWLGQHKANCTGCYIKMFGDVQNFGTFTQLPSVNLAVTPIWNAILLGIIMLIVSLLN